MSTDEGHGTFGKAHLAGWVPTVSNDESPLFDPLRTSASRLQELLTSGELTSVQIVKQYHPQIMTYNGYLKAVYQLAPGAVDRAKQLDDMRANGDVRGPLHGIPVLLKDNVGTDPTMKMDNTGGNLALVGSTVVSNAQIVTRLLEAGAIILGKTTLSELMWFKGTGISCRWSALHGQSQNPYIAGGVDKNDGPGGHSSPGGSSSGSAISVAAGFAPMAIGTETEGSLVSPSNRQSLFTVKSALGTIPNNGIIPVSCYLDVPGPICTTVEDTADLLTVLTDNGNPDIGDASYSSALKGGDGWRDLRIGTLDPERFRLDESMQASNPEAIAQIKDATLHGYERLKTLAAKYHHFVTLRDDSDFDYEGANPFVELMIADFGPDFDKYMRGTQGTSVSSAKELQEWNLAHAKEVLPTEFPNQDLIDRSVAFDHGPHYRQKLMECITEVSQSFPDTLEKYDINVIIGPGDIWFSKYSAATAFPLCSLPLGYIDFNGRPIGLLAIAKSEVTLLTLMSAFESSFPPRKPPSAFLSEAARI
ncbi:amidase family protein [Astrocystis sublimbata]|nr:amidase family protein [Astrocystis sublimbata]